MITLLNRLGRVVAPRWLPRWAVGGVWIFCAALLAMAPGVVHASALSDAAAALQPGHYVELATDLVGQDFWPDYPGDTGGSMLDWSDSGAWDPVLHKFYFTAKKAGCSNLYRTLVYDEATNQWTYGPVPLSSGCGHGYDGNTSDPSDGTHYFHAYFDSPVWKRVGGGPWTSMQPLPSGNLAGIAASPAGLLFSDYSYDVWYEKGSGTQHAVNVSSQPRIGGYNSITEYDPIHNAFLVAGGNDADREMRKVVIQSNVPVRTVLNDAPVSIGTGEDDQKSIVQCDPVTGEFIVYKRNTGTFYGYNIQTDAWRTLGTSGNGNMPPLPVGSSTTPIGAAINTYGVIMYVVHVNNGPNAHVYLYKHGATGPPDAVPPGVPGNLIAR